MVDGHGRDDGVEAAEHAGQRLGEVVLDELDTIVAGEALARRPEHDLGEVEPYPAGLGSIGRRTGEQPAVTRAEVEDAPGVARHDVEQNALTLGAARKVIRSL